VLAAGSARATVYFVDGACATSGSGTGTGIACGPTGPFVTIGEGVLALEPGDTLNVRGPHDAFDGVYFESLALRDLASVPGKSLACTADQPCVIQGCRAGACLTDEVPIIRGMTLRSDWVPQGGGVYSRTMEASPNTDPLARDDFDPTILVQGTAYPLELLGYAGDGVSAPPEDQWSYDPTTQQIFVHPTGGADPTPTVFVPHFGFNVAVQTPTAWVTLQYLSFEGVRGYSIHIETTAPATPIAGMTLSHLIQRYAGRKFIQTTRGTQDTIIEDTISEYGGRGISFATNTNDGFFGYRLFGFQNGIMRRNTIRHIGATGQVRLSGGTAWPCPWCDPPWNDPTHTFISTSGTAYQVKQTDTATMEDNLAEDISTVALGLDVSRHVTVQRNTVRRASTGFAMLNFTPTAGCPTTAPTEYCYNSDDVIAANVLDEVGYADIAGCGITVVAGGARVVGGSMLAQVYNNVVSRIGFAGVCVATDDPTYDPTPTADLSIWNNTIYGARDVAGAAPSTGLIVPGATQNVVVLDNAFDGLTSDAMLVGTLAAQGLTMDGDVIGTVAGCQVRFGTGTCDQLDAHEAHGRTGPLAFVAPAADPPDLHLTARSVAIDAGVPDAVLTDIDGDARPQGAGWDAGADEFVPIATTTSTTTVSSTSIASTSTTTSTTSTTAPAAALTGQSLVLKDETRRPSARRFRLVSTDREGLTLGAVPAIPSLIAQGGSLRVVAIGGDEFSKTYPLAARGWQLIDRRHPDRGVRYRNESSAIELVRFEVGKRLVVQGDGINLDQSLAREPSVVEVELRIGPREFCLAFGGERKQFAPRKRLRRMRAGRPATCPEG
jgi:hypothetical protein